MVGSLPITRRVRVWFLESLTIAGPTAQPEAIVPLATVAILGTVVVPVVSTELFEGRSSSISANLLVFGGRFEDWFSNRYGYHMLTHAGLVLPRWTRTVRGDTALDMDGVSVVASVPMRPIRHLYVAVTEKRELERFPSRSFLYLFVGVEYVHHIGRG
nr:hypothetical protein [Halorubrum rutilum]